MKQGQVIVISGPSGVGKSTICRRLCEMLPADWSVSVTTRPARKGEVHGVHYRFVSDAEYQTLVDQGGLLEHARVHGNGYGTPAAPVLEAIGKGRSIVLEIDVKGAMQVKARIPDAVLVFVMPPSHEELERRIRDRKTEREADILQRLSKSEAEIQAARESGKYDAFVVNDDLAHTEDKILLFIQQRHALAQPDGELSQ